MKYRAEIKINKYNFETIQRYLHARVPADYQGEDNTISFTARFHDGIEADVKCCGSDDGPSWTKAVLFKDGHEVSCTGVEEGLLGEWSLNYDGDEFIVSVIVVAELKGMSKREFFVETPVGRLHIHTKHENSDNMEDYPGVYIDFVREDNGQDTMLACVEWDSLRKMMMATLYTDENSDEPTVIERYEGLEAD